MSLQAALALIENPEHWTKGASARVKHKPGQRPGSGNQIGWAEKNAYCFCMSGALRRAFGTSEEGSLYGAIDRLAEVIIEKYPAYKACPNYYGAVIPLFNDDEDTTHEMVVEVFKEAISR